MYPIEQGKAQNQTLTVRAAGVAVAIPLTSTVTVDVLAGDGGTVLLAALPVLSSTPGSDWANGIVVAVLTALQTAALPLGTLFFRVNVDTPATTALVPVEVVAGGAVHSALFKDRAATLASLRQDPLLAAAKRFFPNVALTDDALWGYLVAAEADAQRQLRVFFEPTEMFPYPPSQAEIDALNGAPWAEEAANDYDPEFFQGERWGFIVTRQHPVVQVRSIKFMYPSPALSFFTIPNDWIRVDKKYGHIRLVPASTAFAAPLNAFLMQAMGGGRTIPMMIQVRYVAGLQNAAQNWPDLIDMVKKMAVLRIIDSAFVPQSGSISADGLSQSSSIDVSKYQDRIDHYLNGDKGSNGGLRAAIHGIQGMVLGVGGA